MRVNYILISIFIHFSLIYILNINMKNHIFEEEVRFETIKVSFHIMNTPKISTEVQKKDTELIKVMKNNKEIKKEIEKNQEKKEKTKEKTKEKIEISKKEIEPKIIIKKVTKDINTEIKISKEKTLKIDEKPKEINQKEVQSEIKIEKEIKPKAKLENIIEESKKIVKETNLNENLIHENVVEEKIETKLDKEDITVIKAIKIIEEEQNLGENFIKSEDGNWIAKSQRIKGLNINFISNPSPEYPKIAEKLGLRKEFDVKVRFLVGTDGKIEEIKFYSIPECEKYGFNTEVKKALLNWRLESVKFQDQVVKVYFYKTFKFKL